MSLSVETEYGDDVAQPILARLLVIRFSSFGDIVQACGVPRAFQQHFRKSGLPLPEVDWLVREDFADLLRNHPTIHTVHSFPRKEGLFELIKKSWQLAKSHYSHVYDAHNNLRSRVVCAVFFSYRLLHPFQSKAQFIRRPKHRLRRWLFFKLSCKTLPTPFRGALSFHTPLKKWGIPALVPVDQVFFVSQEAKQSAQAKFVSDERATRIALAPSAAWEMKRWPVQHWQSLIEKMPDCQFVLLGGSEDQFIAEIAKIAPSRCLNLAGQQTLLESCAVLEQVDLLISNDTGLLHASDQMARPAIALIGPTAFGYPSHVTSKVAEISLPCKPCSKDGRGRCSNSIYKRCLMDLSPDMVVQLARESLR